MELAEKIQALQIAESEIMRESEYHRAVTEDLIYQLNGAHIILLARRELRQLKAQLANVRLEISRLRES